MTGEALLPVPLEWVTQGGAVGLLAVVALMVFLGLLVPRSIYRAMERDRDTWRDVALKAIAHSDQLLPVAQVATEVTRHLVAATDGQQQHNEARHP